MLGRLEALMRIDLYTKTLLTVIALALLMIACKSVLEPNPVSAEGPLSGVQVSLMPMGVGIFVFDTKTGEIWVYGENNQAQYHGKITKLGAPLDMSPHLNK